jgi:hypothetical protein
VAEPRRKEKYLFISPNLACFASLRLRSGHALREIQFSDLFFIPIFQISLDAFWVQIKLALPGVHPIHKLATAGEVIQIAQ